MDAVFVITGNTALEVRQELRCVWREREKGSLGRGRDCQEFGEAEVCMPPSPALPLSAGVPASFLQSRSRSSQKLGWSWRWQRVIVSGTPTFPMCCEERISSRVCCSLKLFVSKSLDDIQWRGITMSRKVCFKNTSYLVTFHLWVMSPRYRALGLVFSRHLSVITLENTVGDALWPEEQVLGPECWALSRRSQMLCCLYRCPLALENTGLASTEIFNFGEYFLTSLYSLYLFPVTSFGQEH